MSAATQNEMDRLKRVNREQQLLLDQVWKYVDQQGLAQLGQSRVMALIEAHRQVAAERDALAAHVESYMGSLSRTIEAWKKEANEGDGIMQEHEGVMREARRLLSLVQQPRDSLARLKAQAKAEAFENLANYEGHWTQRDMEAIASDYRRQAEEPSP